MTPYIKTRLLVLLGLLAFGGGIRLMDTYVLKPSPEPQAVVAPVVEPVDCSDTVYVHELRAVVATEAVAAHIIFAVGVRGLQPNHDLVMVGVNDALNAINQIAREDQDPLITELYEYLRIYRTDILSAQSPDQFTQASIDFLASWVAISQDLFDHLDLLDITELEAQDPLTGAEPTVAPTPRPWEPTDNGDGA